MWPDYLKTRETERLLLRPLVPEDARAWEAFVMDEKATEFFPSDWKLSPEKAKEWIEFQLKRYADSRYGLQALIEKGSGKLIGQCGLLAQHIDNVDELEVGYHLLPAYWGKGYASEAAQAFKAMGFDNGLADSIISIIDVGNTASQKVAERNGMRRGVRTEYYGMEVFVYRISREEYLGS